MAHYFIPRLLLISCTQTANPEEPTLDVTHLLYLAWPDHGVPRDCMSLVTFVKLSRKFHPVGHQRPLLVHCSAGVGRTGTFVVLDSMMQRMKAKNSFNIYHFLSNLRKQRVLLVQTEVHDAQTISSVYTRISLQHILSLHSTAETVRFHPRCSQGAEHMWTDGDSRWRPPHCYQQAEHENWQQDHWISETV